MRHQQLERERKERLEKQIEESVLTLKSISSKLQDDNDEVPEDKQNEDDFDPSYDYDTDDDGNDDISRERRIRFRRSYMPPDNSTIGQSLKKFQGMFITKTYILFLNF